MMDLTKAIEGQKNCYTDTDRVRTQARQFVVQMVFEIAFVSLSLMSKVLNARRPRRALRTFD